VLAKIYLPVPVLLANWPSRHYALSSWTKSKVIDEPRLCDLGSQLTPWPTLW